MNLSVRFWNKVAQVGNICECWLWLAALSDGGYGKFNGNVAHRVSYELIIGAIPSGLELDHLCRVRDCVNPYHLEPVTTQENTKRGERGNTGLHNRIKTHCSYGHEYTKENTGKTIDGKYEFRYCRKCKRIRQANKAKQVS